jgi:Protein of unknown function (DUF1257)
LRANVVVVLDGDCDIGWIDNFMFDGTYDFIADLWGVSRKHNVNSLLHKIDQKYRELKSRQYG